MPIGRGDSAPDWLLARRTLDHRQTVVALTLALSVGSTQGPYEAAAEELATSLARAGLGLVQIDKTPAAYPGGFFTRGEDN